VIYIINDQLVSVSRGKCSEMTDLIATAGTDFGRGKGNFVLNDFCECLRSPNICAKMLLLNL
jgi:hypothetical protein